MFAKIREASLKIGEVFPNIILLLKNKQEKVGLLLHYILIYVHVCSYIHGRLSMVNATGKSTSNFVKIVADEHKLLSTPRKCILTQK